MSKALALRSTLLAKKAELLKADNPEYKTSGEFRPSIYSQRGVVHIKMATQEEILQAFKELKYQEECAKELGISTRHLGFLPEEWIEDFKTRIAVLKRSQTFKDIEALETELKPLLTSKEAREIGIADLSEKIKTLE